MPPAPGAHAIGPANGHLHLRTAREGVAARVGHDLLIAVGDWSGRIIVGAGGPADASVVVEAETGSLAILEGSGGAVPLSARDREDIGSTARRLLEVERFPQVTFTSDAVEPAAGGDGGSLRGTLTLLGQSRPVTFEVTADDAGHWLATATVLQSQFGIKPYSAVFGALRLADPVDVEVRVDLSAT